MNNITDVIILKITKEYKCVSKYFKIFTNRRMLMEKLLHLYMKKNVDVRIIVNTSKGSYFLVFYRGLRGDFLLVLDRSEDRFIVRWRRFSVLLIFSLNIRIWIVCELIFVYILSSSSSQVTSCDNMIFLKQIRSCFIFSACSLNQRCAKY